MSNWQHLFVINTSGKYFDIYINNGELKIIDKATGKEHVIREDLSIENFREKTRRIIEVATK